MSSQWDFSADQQHSLELASIWVSVISFIGSTFIILCYFKLRDLRNFAFRLVLMMAVSDIGFSIGCFLGDTGSPTASQTWLGGGDGTGLCNLQAVLLSYFQLTSFLWSVSIAFTLHMAFLNERADFSPQQIAEHERKYHIFCWCVPAVLTLLPFSSGAYGDTNGWCWIKNSSTKDGPYNQGYWRFAQFYLILWAGIVYTGVVFFKIYRKIKTMDSSSNSTASRLKLYPFVLLFCHFWSCVVAFYEMFHDGYSLYWLTMCQVVFAASLGFINAVVYGMTPEVFRQICQNTRLPCVGDPNGAHQLANHDETRDRDQI